MTVFGLLVMAGNAVAQSAAVERNVAPGVRTASPPIGLPDEAAVAADKRPLGADLAGIKLIGAQEQPDIGAMRGVALGEIGAGRSLEPDLTGALRPFLGKPISMSLIAEAQAAIAGVYRRAGYPFVSVTIPPQEITGGVLNLRVIEFGFGSVATRGVSVAPGARMASQVRAVQGDRIAAASVNEDLAWLNRSPFRRVQGLFSPGSANGTSDLVLDVTGSKPWQVYGGYNNLGSKATGYSRFFMGAGFALPGIDGGFATYQLTGSSDLFGDPAGIFPSHDGNRARYASHSARFVVPLGDRQAIEFSPFYVATRQSSDGFDFDSGVIELPLYYRSALSNILPGVYGGEVYAGIEYKHLSRDTLFSGVDIGGSEAEIFQFGLGVTHRLIDDLGSTDIDIRVKANPGGIFAGNTDSAWDTYSNGTVRETSYAYLSGNLTRSTDIGAGFRLANVLLFQLAGQALPDTEKLSLGGIDGVRGYGLNDAVADTGIILRNELRSPVLSANDMGQFSPFAFIDFGFGRDRATGNDFSLASAGAGIDYNLAGYVTLSAVAALALADEGNRNAGDFDFRLRLTAWY